MTSYRNTGLILFLTAVPGFLCGLSGCHSMVLNSAAHETKPQAVLEMMSVSWGANVDFSRGLLHAFGQRNSIKTQFVPNARLEVYQSLLRAHSGEPDLLELDIVWPAILADDLVDLRSYLPQKDLDAYPKQFLDDYTVRGRLVAVPLYVDLGILYYRPELLNKYGFRNPPQTWDELEKMAARIQKGERDGGNKDFWGYVWQGAVSEGGTCNALEWQAAAGGGNFLEAGMVHVRSARFADALRRSTRWIGTISPPAEFVYREDDTVNVWNAGQTAFMRNWASGYGHVAKRPGRDSRPFEVAALPAGPGGHRGTLGGLGIGVSKYAANRALAIKALLELSSEENDLRRSYITEGIPTRTTNFNKAEVKARSQLLAVSGELISGLVSRPALLSGEKYTQVSLQYAKAVNSVLRGKATADGALAQLEQELVRTTGLPAKPNSN